MNSEKQIQLYLEGSLKGADLELFRKKLKEDETFRLLILDYQKAWNMIESQHRKLNMVNRLKERLRMSRSAISPEQIKTEVEKYFQTDVNDAASEEKFKKVLMAFYNKSNRKSRRIGYIIAIAACILLFVGIPLTFMLNPEHKKSAQLFEQYYAPYPYIMHERNAGIADSSLNAKLMYLYTNHFYADASSILSENRIDSLSDPLHGLYLGICYMEMKRYKEAINTFKYVISQHQHLTFDQANWYLGLTYLKLNKSHDAKDYFLKVKSDSSQFSKQAIELLNKMSQK